MKKSFVSNVPVVMLALALFLVGCGSGGSSSSITTEYAMEDDYDYAATESLGVYDNKSVSSYEDESSMEEVTDTSRKLITTVYISAETEEFDKTLSLIEDKVKELGGYIENSNIYNGSRYSGGSVTRDASLTIRIPAAKLDSFIDTVDGNTNITNKSTNVEDVTLTYVDIESRKSALSSEEKRLLEILDSAETVEDIITVEDRLAEVRYELESIESQLRTYDNRINYSTVDITLEEVATYTDVSEKGPIQRMAEGFVESVNQIITTVIEGFVYFVIHIPQILVFAILGLIIFLIIKKADAGARKKAALRQKNMPVQGNYTYPYQPRQTTYAPQTNAALDNRQASQTNVPQGNGQTPKVNNTQNNEGSEGENGK